MKNLIKIAFMTIGSIKLGSFVNKEDAIKARKDAEEKLHKEFLREKGLL